MSDEIIKVTIPIDKDIANDIKFIAMFESKTQQDLWPDVAKSFVVNWKKKNPKVTFPPKNKTE